MKPIQKDELFGQVSSYLKTRGVELKEGSYSQAVERSCGILADVINLTQQGVERAREEIDKRVDQMRQVIHEKTAPHAQPTASAAGPGASEPAAAASEAGSQSAKAQAKTRSRAHQGRKPQPRKAVRKSK